jgi:hypothetical protein
VTTDQGDGPLGLGEALERLGRVRLADHSMSSLLDLVVGLAQRSLPGRPEASITLMKGGRPYTAAFSGTLAKDLDESQYGHGYGPCLEAATSGVVVEVLDTRDDDRWPGYVESAARHGCRSSLSLPLPLHASYAAVAAENILLYENTVARAANLEVALRSRAVIDQAKGMLMERFRLTADQAFAALAQVSMDSNRKVRDVAERFVETGEWGGASGR